MTSAPLDNGHWDAPGISRDWTKIWNDSVNDLDKARLLALIAAHSSDWLFALLISSCGMRMCDNPIRVAVGLRLGLTFAKRTLVLVVQQ